jgi:hypothetical protein
MKTQLLLCILILMLILSQNQLSGQKIYVAPAGNDNNTGSIEKPLATLTAARDRAREYRKSNQVNTPIEKIALHILK